MDHVLQTVKKVCSLSSVFPGCVDLDTPVETNATVDRGLEGTCRCDPDSARTEGQWYHEGWVCFPKGVS